MFVLIMHEDASTASRLPITSQVSLSTSQPCHRAHNGLPWSYRLIGRIDAR